MTSYQLTTNLTGPAIAQARQEPNCSQHPELVLLTLTIPLWSFVTLYLLLVLIHYLRWSQYFILYDKCTNKNAYFRYDFHIVIGKYSINYNKQYSNLIIDLLDNQLISTMTIQVPSTTIFNDNQPFMYRHSRADLRCVSFSVYRRHPIKDVKCIRMAHSCANPESRLFVYGLNLMDVTNGESKFFPITSIIKYRGTQWALTTSFEPKADTNFSKLGCSCYDPFGSSNWPTYMESLISIFFIWSAVLCFGSLISVDMIANSATLHALAISFIVGSSIILLAFIYLRFFKLHISDNHYDSSIWQILSNLFLAVVIGLALLIWTVALRQEQACATSSIDWAKSSIGSASILSLLLITTYYLSQRRRASKDNAALDCLETNLIKTNSRNNIEFVKEPVSRCNLFKAQPNSQTLLPVVAKKLSKSNKPTGSGSHKHIEPKKGSKPSSKQRGETRAHDPETLDNAFKSENNTYIKTKNRNSISQYV